VSLVTSWPYCFEIVPEIVLESSDDPDGCVYPVPAAFVPIVKVQLLESVYEMLAESPVSDPTYTVPDADTEVLHLAGPLEVRAPLCGPLDVLHPDDVTDDTVTFFNVMGVLRSTVTDDSESPFCTDTPNRLAVTTVGEKVPVPVPVPPPVVPPPVVPPPVLGFGLGLRIAVALPAIAMNDTALMRAMRSARGRRMMLRDREVTGWSETLPTTR
jgi:hypothetical protein